MNLKAQATKAKMDNWEYSILKRFYTAKKTIHEPNRQTTEWGKTLVNCTPGKDLIAKIYKELKQLKVGKQPPH
jgi:hypothetical protein